MNNKIKVMLVDDHKVVRFGFRLLLDSTPDICVVTEADSADSAYLQLDAYMPDVVVMDVTLGSGANGAEITRRILLRNKSVRILALSSHEDPSYVRFMLKAGAQGYLSKRSAPDELIHSIRRVAAGHKYLDAHVSQRMALQEFNADRDPVAVLSAREFEVFVDLANGLAPNQVATKLNISPRTAGTHLYNIKQKLGVANQSELVLIAVKHGVVAV
jgi:two-component system invasion response regulator UvrY